MLLPGPSPVHDGGKTDRTSATTTSNAKQPFAPKSVFDCFYHRTSWFNFAPDQFQSRFSRRLGMRKWSLSHLLGLLGLLLRVPGVPVVHTSLLLRWGPEQAVYERGRRRRRGRHSPVALAGDLGWRVVVVANHLAVGWGRSLHSRALFVLPGQGVLGLHHSDAWVDARGRGLQPGREQQWQTVSVTAGLEPLCESVGTTTVTRDPFLGTWPGRSWRG